jgi:hypothetical protein
VRIRLGRGYGCPVLLSMCSKGSRQRKGKGETRDDVESARALSEIKPALFANEFGYAREEARDSRMRSPP